MSLFGERKLIELRIPSGKPGKEGSQALQDYAKACAHSTEAGDTLTLITLPKLDWTTQKSAWVSALQQAGVYVDIPLVERAWLGERIPACSLAALRIAFGIVMPLLHGCLGVYLGKLTGLELGGATLLGVLAASASYIAAPAAIRMSLPDANPTFYLTSSLAVTFPFNIALGIPIYFEVARRLYT